MGPTPDIEFLELMVYESTDAVQQALLTEELDITCCIGPLAAKQVQNFKFYHSNVVDVRHSDVLQVALVDGCEYK